MSIVIIGIGNEDRGDDAVGLLVARKLSKEGLSGISIREYHGDPTLLIEAWKHNDAVFVIDAVSSGATPGTVHRFEADTMPPAARGMFRCSTHGVGIAEAIELARALKQLPRRVIVYGIEGASFRLGEAASPAALAGIGKAIDGIMTELKRGGKLATR